MLAKKVEMRLGPGGRRVPAVTAGDLRQQQDGQQTEDRMLDVAPAVVLDPGKDPTNSRQHALSPTGLNACGYGRQITAAYGSNEESILAKIKQISSLLQFKTCAPALQRCTTEAGNSLCVTTAPACCCRREHGADGRPTCPGAHPHDAQDAAELRVRGGVERRGGAGGDAPSGPASDAGAWAAALLDRRRKRHAQEGQALGRRGKAVLW